MFNKLANSVEDFTTRLLDPMQSDQLQREGFGYFILDDILDEAIDLKQKKVMSNWNELILSDNRVNCDNFLDQAVIKVVMNFDT